MSRPLVDALFHWLSAQAARVSRKSKLGEALAYNLLFDEWTSVFGSKRLIGALLDRFNHHVPILEMNGESYRLAHSKRRRAKAKMEEPHKSEGQTQEGPRGGLLADKSDAISLRRRQTEVR